MRYLLIIFLTLSSLTLAEDFLVPLDDRPANLLFVKQIARIADPNANLRTPPAHLLGKLYTPGRSSEIIDWVEREVKEGDTLFVSTDMWLYGGLVASRTAEISPQVVSERLQRLEAIGGRGVFVHALATVPRLSLRTSDKEAPHERKLAQWATKKELPSATELLKDQALYPKGIPAEIVREYLEVRVRNTDTVLKLLSLVELGFVDSLTIGQDDSHKTGLHRFEQSQIRDQMSDLNLGSKAVLISGIDELSMDLIAGVQAQRAGVKPSVRVIYSEPEAAKKIPPLESLPLEQMVQQHIELAGARLENSEQAQVDLFIYVPYKKPWKVPGEERRPSSESFVAKVQKAMDEGRQVAVADLSLVNRMDPFLAESSLESLKLYDLEAFASWNTPANTFGTVIAQLVCHAIAEQSTQWSWEQRLEAEKTHQAFLLARFIDDYAYQTLVRDQVRGQTKGLSPKSEPLLNLFGPVGLDIRVRLVRWANQVFEKHYLGRQFEVQPQGREVTFERSKLEVVLPWPRVFEVEARLDLRLR